MNEIKKKKNSNDNKSFYESLYKNNFLITKGELSNYPISEMIIKKYIFTEEKKNDILYKSCTLMKILYCCSYEYLYKTLLIYSTTCSYIFAEIEFHFI